MLEDKFPNGANGCQRRKHEHRTLVCALDAMQALLKGRLHAAECWMYNARVQARLARNGGRP